MLAQLETLITEYVDLAAEVKRSVPAFGAIMGNKQDVMHPGHMAFFHAVQNWTVQFCETDPGQDELVQALEMLLLSAKKYENTAACWYLTAVQGHAKCLIPRLEASSREALRQHYVTAYPAGKQLPLQKEIYALLGGKSRNWFRFWKSN